MIFFFHCSFFFFVAAQLLVRERNDKKSLFSFSLSFFALLHFFLLFYKRSCHSVCV
eukprot:GAFH01006025.1.p6 GENE.GAFH01006025.1~~GAFH01006025.1.p6  ORF type:complete len:56 (-),score=5.86 GAFH01006025.1:214-381(-)